MKDKKKTDERKPEVETPRPPQVMDPSRPPEKDEETSGVKNQVPKDLGEEETIEKETKKKKKDKEKLLGESPLEIDDETTI